MARIVAHCWIHLVMWLTGILPDFTPVLRLRGWLVGFGLKRCGRDFQIASGVTLNSPNHLEVGEHVYLAKGCWLHAGDAIVLEDEVQFGPYVVAITGDHAIENGSYRYAGGKSGPIRVGRGSWIAAHVTILRDVNIGRGVLVAANAVVTSDLPDFAIAGGVPAKVLKYADETVTKAIEPRRIDAGGEPIRNSEQTVKHV